MKATDIETKRFDNALDEILDLEDVNHQLYVFILRYRD